MASSSAMVLGMELSLQPGNRAQVTASESERRVVATGEHQSVVFISVEQLLIERTRDDVETKD